MSTEYIFYECPPFGDGEFDISGKDYEALLRLCEKYCSFMTLSIVHSGSEAEAALEKFRVGFETDFKYGYGVIGKQEYEESPIKSYRVCKELIDTMLTVTNSLLDWTCLWREVKRPDDPVFFREDGSIFLRPIVHEGECHLFLKDGENADEVITCQGWEKYEPNRSRNPEKEMSFTGELVFDNCPEGKLPLIFFTKCVFRNEEKEIELYISGFTREKLIPEGFEKGKKYTVVYDEFRHITDIKECN